MPGHSLDVSHKQWALSAIARDSSSWLTSPLVLGQGATSATYSCVGFTSSWVWLFVFPPLVHLHKPPASTICITESSQGGPTLLASLHAVVAGLCLEAQMQVLFKE